MTDRGRRSTGGYRRMTLGLAASATFQSIPGPNVVGNYVATNAVMIARDEHSNEGSDEHATDGLSARL